MSALTRWLLPRGVLFAVLAALMAVGALEPVSRALSDWRFGMTERAPSGTLTVVEIDTTSLRALETWPWPRDRYAQAIENLRAAGAKIIGLDVDFSSKSTPEQDARLARAIEAGDGDVILPVFVQPERHGDMVEMIEVQPDESLRKGALFASVNLIPESDGQLRKAHLGFTSIEGFRPSMAAVLAGEAAPLGDAFLIDFGIDESKITRLSFVDVLSGTFDKSLVDGRAVLIGATALELGDEFAVPVHGIASGVELHALSYESIVGNRQLMRSSTVFALLLALVVIAALGRDRKDWSWAQVLAPHVGLAVVALVVPVAAQIAWPVSIDPTPVLAAQLLCLGRTVGTELERRAREIFRQRALNARQQALVMLTVKDSSDGVVVTDAQGRIELCNERAATLLGVDPAGAVGLKLSDVAPRFPLYPTEPGSGAEAIPADCFPVVQEFIAGDQVLEVNADWTLCETSPSLSDRSLDVEARTRVLKRTPLDPETVAAHREHIFVYTLRDISARKRIEETERQAKAALIAAANAKTQFIHNMSHELRTPLNAVIGFSEMMCSEVAGPLTNPTYKEYAELVHQNGRHLLALINDVLDVTKLEGGEVKLEREWVNLGPVVEAARERCEDMLGARTFAADVPDDFPRLDVDRKLLASILSHLISNAAKFTAEDGHISVGARVAGADGDVVIEVRDNGVGVDPQLLPRLTEAFYQADPSLSRRHEGTGLGLYLVTKYLALHNGTLELDSAPGQGFTARMRFPKSAQAPRKPHLVRAAA